MLSGLLLLTITSASAADINAVLPTGGTGNLTGNFSSSSTWVGGVVPGASDNAIVPATGLDWFLTYDAAAPAVLGSWRNNRSTVTFDRSVTVNGILTQREGSFNDNGFDITALGTFSNTTNGGSDWSGGFFVRNGGNYALGGLALGRSSSFSFRSGDTCSGDYDTFRIFNSWPDIEIRQDATNHPDDLDIGMSFDGIGSQINLGRNSSADQAEIRLYWDSGIQGTNDWIMRWRGDHVTQLTTYYNNGQLVASAVPSGETFDPVDNIYYNSSDDYTYVGFQPADLDGDGVPNGSDVCPEDPNKGLDAGFCGCNYIDYDIDGDLVDETCLHITADVHPGAVVQAGATVHANAVVAPRAVLGPQGIVGANAVVGRRASILGEIGDDVVVGRSASIASGSTVGNDAVIGFGSTITGTNVGTRVTIGALVNIDSGSSVGSDTVIARGADLGTNAQIANDVTIGPNVSFQNDCTVQARARIRSGATFLSNVTVEEDARVGRDALLGAPSGAAVIVGSDAVLGANVVVPAGFCVASDTRVERATTVDTPCP